jgi:hypothetical protein
MPCATIFAMDAPPSASPASPGPPAEVGAEPRSLRERMAAAGRTIGARESRQRAALDAAQRRCRALHEQVGDALDAFHMAAVAAGAPHLEIVVGMPRLDDKHVRAAQFELRRGRHVGIVVVKTKGTVTLVGPFRRGKPEGPCRSFPADAQAELEAALGEFLERFVEEAMSP